MSYEEFINSIRGRRERNMTAELMAYRNADHDMTNLIRFLRSRKVDKQMEFLISKVESSLQTAANVREMAKKIEESPEEKAA